MGTLLAFMISVVALSLPELILLRRVLKPQLLAGAAGGRCVGAGDPGVHEANPGLVRRWARDVG